MTTDTTASQLHRDYVIAVLLLLLAGFVDAISFVVLGGNFVSFMSGNSTIMASSIAAGKWGLAGLTGGLIGTFFAGAAAGAAIYHWGGAHAQRLVLLAVLVVLSVGITIATIGPLTPGMLVVAAGTGILNAALLSSPVGGALTYVTGTLVKSAQGLVQGLAEGDPWRWLRTLWMWLVFCLGAVAGGVAQRAAGTASLWGGVVLATAAMAVSLITPRPPSVAHS